MKYKNQTLKKYLDDLSAKLSAPGGGSAAAFNAAMGAGLMMMAINFTLGKPQYRVFRKELGVLRVKTEKFEKRFLELVDEDVEAYRSKDLRYALKVPLELSRLCCKAAELCPVLMRKGNPNLSSDTAMAAVLLESAFVCACFNVRINLKILKDSKLAGKIEKELRQKGKTVLMARKETEAGFGKIIRR